jgi:triosephosphate isomerase
MQRKPIIAGNWKMNCVTQEAVQLVTGLKRELFEEEKVEVVVCPPFTALGTIGEMIEGSLISLGAQNVFWEKKGAYTGEVSGDMLKDIGCKYVIIGHSERRQYFGETNETVNKRVKAALSIGLCPIMCVGETKAEREKGITKDVVENHIYGGLKDIDADSILNCVIAYEPVWAIGTGLTATPEQAEEVHDFIRNALLSKMYGHETAGKIRIQYGGSVTPDNIKALMAQKDIDGALVGGASLKVESFVKIVKYYM